MRYVATRFRKAGCTQQKAQQMLDCEECTAGDHASSLTLNMSNTLCSATHSASMATAVYRRSPAVMSITTAPSIRVAVIGSTDSNTLRIQRSCAADEVDTAELTLIPTA